MNFTTEKPKDFALIGQLNRTLNKIEKALENIEKPKKDKTPNFDKMKSISNKGLKRIEDIANTLNKSEKEAGAEKDKKSISKIINVERQQNKLQALKELKEKAEQKKREEQEKEFREKQLTLLSSIKQGIDEQVEEYKKKNALEKLQEKTETKLNKISAKRDYKFAKNHSNLAEISENGLGNFLAKRIVSVFDKDLREQIKYEKQKRIIEAEKTYKDYSEKDEVLSNIDNKEKIEQIKAKRQKEAIASQKYDHNGKVNQEFLELSKNSIGTLKEEIESIKKEKTSLFKQQLELFQKGEKEQALEMQSQLDELSKKLTEKQDTLKGMQFVKNASKEDINDLDKDSIKSVKAIRDKKTTREIIEEKRAKAKELLNSDKMVSGIVAIKEGIEKLFKSSEKTNKNLENIEDLQEDEIRATKKVAMSGGGSNSGLDIDLDKDGKRRRGRSRGWKKYLKKGGSLIKRAGGALVGTIGSMASGAVSTVSAFATGGLSAGLEAGAAALATNPVGWAVAGALAVGAIGYGIYHLMIDDDSEEVVDRLEKMGAFDHSFFGDSTITKWQVVYALPKKDLNALERYDDFSDKTMKTIKNLQKIPKDVRDFLAREITKEVLSADKDGILSIENQNSLQKDIQNAIKSKAFTTEELLKSKVLFDNDGEKWIENNFKSKPKKKEQPKKDGKISENNKGLTGKESKEGMLTKAVKTAFEATPMGYVASKVGGAVKDFVKAHKETINKVERAIFNVTPAGMLYHLINGDTSVVDALIDKGYIDHHYWGDSEIKRWDVIYSLDKNKIKALIDYDDWSKETTKTLNNLLKVDIKIRKFLSSVLASKTIKADKNGILTIIDLKQFVNYLKAFKKKEKVKSISDAFILFDANSSKLLKNIDKPIKQVSNPKKTKPEIEHKINEKQDPRKSKNDKTKLKSDSKQDSGKSQVKKIKAKKVEHSEEIKLLQKELVKSQKLKERYELAAQGIVPITERDRKRQQILIQKAEKEQEKIDFINKKLKELKNDKSYENTQSKKEVDKKSKVKNKTYKKVNAENKTSNPNKSKLDTFNQSKVQTKSGKSDVPIRHTEEINLLKKEKVKAQKLTQRYELAAQGIVPITERDKKRKEALIKKAEKEKEKVSYIDKKLKELSKPSKSKSTDLSVNKTNPKIEKKEDAGNGKTSGTTAISQGSSNTTIINNYSNPFTSGLAVVTNNGV